jgi:beta-N-acetylhexosaminidase
MSIAKPSPATPTIGPVMLDVAGLVLTQDDCHRLMHPLVGGVILFSRNFESSTQLRALTQAIHTLRPELLITVDHEGGRVQRFKAGFTRLPTMQTLGLRYLEDPQLGEQAAIATGFVMATELLAHGVDMSFTPVLDLDFGRSEVIGNRAFHRDPLIVIAVVKALLQGLQLAGMASCGKHFPGHGWVEADSHHAIPVDERPLEALELDDLVPYYALCKDHLSSIMPAHVIYSAIDAQPAGFSTYWLQTILRQRLGFNGVIFSDDLTMEGATVAGTITQRAQAAIHAGCDMVLVCNQPDLADELLHHLVVDTESNSYQQSQLRVQRLKPHTSHHRPHWLNNPQFEIEQALVKSLTTPELIK